MNVLLDRVWRARTHLPGLCLEYAAYAAAKMGQDDRALQLIAVGNVREGYDRARCLPPSRRGYSSYADMHGIAQAMLSMDTSLFRRRATDWLPLAKSAAGQDATFRYAVDLTKVCDLSGPRPEAEWPEARAKVVAAILSVQTPTSSPKTEAPASVINPPAPPPADAPPSPPAPSGSRSPRP